MNMRNGLRFGVSLASAAIFFISACTTPSSRQPAASRMDQEFSNRTRETIPGEGGGSLNAGKNMSETQGTKTAPAKKLRSVPTSAAVNPNASVHQYFGSDLPKLSAKDLKSDAMKAIVQEDGMVQAKERGLFLGGNKAVLVADKSGSGRQFVPSKSSRGPEGPRDMDAEAPTALKKGAKVEVASAMSREKSYSNMSEIQNSTIHPDSNQDVFSSATDKSPKSQFKAALGDGGDPGAGTFVNPNGKTAAQKAATQKAGGAPTTAKSTSGFDDYYEPNDSIGTSYDLSYWENLWLSGLHGSGRTGHHGWRHFETGHRGILDGFSVHAWPDL